MTRDDVCSSAEPVTLTDLSDNPTPYQGSHDAEVRITYLHKNGRVIRSLGGSWTMGQLFELAMAMESAYADGLASR